MSLQQRSISVAMCTYNGARFLPGQLVSIARQQRLPLELVVVDDRSTDGTLDILSDFAKSVPFVVTVHVNAENKGGAAKGITRNFEAATRLCRGELIVPCDQDDIWDVAKLARLAAVMEATPGLRGVFSDAQLISEAGDRQGLRLSQMTGFDSGQQARLATGKVLPVLLSMTKVYGSALMFDGSLQRYFPVPNSWWFDVWVATMAATHGGLAFVPEDLYQYRIHSRQSSAAYQGEGGLSASLQVGRRLDRWRHSAQAYWQSSQPQLQELYAQLEGERDPRLEGSLAYLRGRMKLLQFRAELPGNRAARILKVLARRNDYGRYFNGWRSMAKDLTA